MGHSVDGSKQIELCTFLTVEMGSFKVEMSICILVHVHVFTFIILKLDSADLSFGQAMFDFRAQAVMYGIH